MAFKHNPTPLSLEQSAGSPLNKRHLSVSASPLLAWTQTHAVGYHGKRIGAIYCQPQQTTLCVKHSSFRRTEAGESGLLSSQGMISGTMSEVSQKK